MTLTDEDIEEFIDHPFNKSDSFEKEVANHLAIVLKQTRADLDTLRKERWHASALLECREKLNIAVEALERMSAPVFPDDLRREICDKALKQIRGEN